MPQIKTRRMSSQFLMGGWLISILSATTLLGSAPLDLDCNAYIGPGQTVHDSPVGPETCSVVEEPEFRNAYGSDYRRLQIGISGTIAGYTVIGRPRLEMLTDLPEFAFAQRGNLGPYFHGIGTYYAEKGSGITLFLPKSDQDWNGKLFVLVHGMSSYGSVGELQPRKPDQYNPLMGDNSFAGLMIDKGYAVAYTSRPAARHENGASEQVTLDDGTVLEGKSFGYHAGLIRDWTEIAENLIQGELGRRPHRTYFYGKSAGASLGHLFNYAPGANTFANGERIFDGLLCDDPGGGWYMPTIHFKRVEGPSGRFHVERDEQDHLHFNEAHRNAFAAQFDVVHQAYVGADFVAGDYLSMKRKNARLLNQKGLGKKSRTYEIVGMSHADAGNEWPSELWSQNLELSGIFDVLIDVLDEWVEQGIEPGPTRSDDYNLGDIDGNGQLENPAVSLPEIACPTGLYYEFPPGVSRPGRTGFAPYLETPRFPINADTTPLLAEKRVRYGLGLPDFDEEWLEPLDSRGRPLDMNHNHVRDTRETIEQAWKRRASEGEIYGILSPDEKLTHARYVSCVARVVSELAKQRLISETAMVHYITEATESHIGRD